MSMELPKRTSRRAAAAKAIDKMKENLEEVRYWEARDEREDRKRGLASVSTSEMSTTQSNENDRKRKGKQKRTTTIMERVHESYENVDDDTLSISLDFDDISTVAAESSTTHASTSNIFNYFFSKEHYENNIHDSEKENVPSEIEVVEHDTLRERQLRERQLQAQAQNRPNGNDNSSTISSEIYFKDVHYGDFSHDTEEENMLLEVELLEQERLRKRQLQSRDRNQHSRLENSSSTNLDYYFRREHDEIHRSLDTEEQNRISQVELLKQKRKRDRQKRERQRQAQAQWLKEQRERQQRALARCQHSGNGQMFLSNKLSRKIRRESISSPMSPIKAITLKFTPEAKLVVANYKRQKMTKVAPLTSRYWCN